MTMRLAGDKLSVVIRAASSQTYGSIEGARDAIADRLAAIGQPLNSLIIQQVGGNADANTNGNAAPRTKARRPANGNQDKAQASKATRTIRARLGAALLAICASSFAGAHAEGSLACEREMTSRGRADRRPAQCPLLGRPDGDREQGRA